MDGMRVCGTQVFLVDGDVEKKVEETAVIDVSSTS